MKYLIIKIILMLLLTQVPNVVAQDTATESAVNDRIQSAINKPKAYIGSITDLTEMNINLSSHNFGTGPSGEIKQIMINEEDTDFFEDGTTTNSIDFEDVAIGDFVVAMGYETREGILEAIRVLVTEAPEETTDANYYGTITEVGVDELTMTKPDGNSLTLVFDENDTDIFTKDEDGEDVAADISDIVDTANVIVFTQITDDEETVASIFIIPSQSPSPLPEPLPES